MNNSCLRSMVARGIAFCGIVVYLVILWYLSLGLMEKGYYFSTLILALFSVIAYKISNYTESEVSAFKHLCIMVLLIAAGLLLVGLWNTDFSLKIKGVLIGAWCISLYGVLLYPYCERNK